MSSIIFRIHQLYLVIPKLFSYSDLTDSGKVVEITVVNKSRRTEEEVRIELNPTLKYEILAASASSIEIIDSVLQIKRISGQDEVSAVLLIEGGDFSKSDISSISSKDAKGKVIEKANDVPPNAGNYSLLLLIPIMLITALYNSDKVSFYYNDILGSLYLKEKKT